MAKLEFFGDKCILRLGSNLKTMFYKDVDTKKTCYFTFL